MGPNHYWLWSPQWEAAAGQALAHLLVASQGQPVKAPGSLTADVFQRALDALRTLPQLTRALPHRRKSPSSWAARSDVAFVVCPMDVP